MKRQLAFILARAQIPIEWLHPPQDDTHDVDTEFQDDLPDDLVECLSNSNLSTQFRQLGKELGVADAKSLEDVYKSHLENSRNPLPPLMPDCTLKISHRGQGLQLRMWTLPEGIWQEPSSMLSSMLVSVTTNSWLRPKRAIAGSTRTRIMVMASHSRFLRLLMDTCRHDECRRQSGVESVVGHGHWPESRRQIHLLF